MKFLAYLGVLLGLLSLSACGEGNAGVIQMTQTASKLSVPPTSTVTPTTTATAPTPTSTPPPRPSESVTLPPATHVSLTPLPANVSKLPDLQAFTWQVVADGFDQPVALLDAMDGSGRLFVVERGGLVRILQDGEVLPTPFLDVRDRIGLTGSTSAGMLGMVFHPGFSENGYFFIHYTNVSGQSVIARLQTDADLSVGDPGTEQPLLKIDYPIGEHKGGDLVFGPDGYLYISIGDGGGPGNGDQAGNAQNPGTLLGSILRIDIDERDPYGIPPDNPFASGGGKPEIWAYGLRNPWRFSFDRLTGDLYIADVGENAWEEIDFLSSGSPAGSNFGWNYFEGTHRYQGKPPPDQVLVEPIFQYDHSKGCSITGGAVYRGEALPEWQGVYVYGDYCQGHVWALLRQPDSSLENQLHEKVSAYITGFGQDQDGELYLVDIGGEIFKLVRK
jgi:glucose/arabinose dehydrogenase